MLIKGLGWEKVATDSNNVRVWSRPLLPSEALPEEPADFYGKEMGVPWIQSKEATDK